MSTHAVRLVSGGTSKAILAVIWLPGLSWATSTSCSCSSATPRVSTWPPKAHPAVRTCSRTTNSNFVVRSRSVLVCCVRRRSARRISTPVADVRPGSRGLRLNVDASRRMRPTHEHQRGAGVPARQIRRTAHPHGVGRGVGSASLRARLDHLSWVRPGKLCPFGSFQSIGFSTRGAPLREVKHVG